MQCHDLLAHVPGRLAHAYPWTYYFLVRHLPSLWGTCFELLDAHPIYTVIQPLRRIWNLTLGQTFVRWLRAESFDVVVATHFLPADLFAAGKQAGWLKAKSVVVITDLHPHRFWVAPANDAFVVATAYTEAVCEKRGIPRSRLRVLGIPTARGFHLPVDREQILRRCGLDPRRRTILVTSGGTTVGPFEAVVESLARLEESLPGRAQLVVVCGENSTVARRLGRRLHGGRMPATVFGFVENMPELMGASDLVIAKAGGLTVMEALSEGLPLILYHAIPGQERSNAQYVARHGAALIARNPREAAAAARRFLDDPAHFAALREAAKEISRPHAAEAIATQVIGPLLTEAAVGRELADAG